MSAEQGEALWSGACCLPPTEAPEPGSGRRFRSGVRLASSLLERAACTPR